MARYKASARILDQKMGAVFDALEQSALAENTLVICTTDHGIAFPRMKCNLQDSGIGVLLMMRGPGGFTGGKACDALVSHVDIFPTLCDFLGIDPPEWLEGRCGSVEIVGEHFHPWGMAEENRPILLCRDLLRPLSEQWAELRHWN